MAQTGPSRQGRRPSNAWSRIANWGYDDKTNGEPGGARTRDHRIKSAMLYQLSYRLLRGKTLLYRATHHGSQFCQARADIRAQVDTQRATAALHQHL